jgi:hypothetical protein
VRAFAILLSLRAHIGAGDINLAPLSSMPHLKKIFC